MKLSISNIGWNEHQDKDVYEMMGKLGFSGIEIAPTRIFPEAPYDNVRNASEWAERLRVQHGFVVSSMQSIWFGRTESIFGTKDERQILEEYTKKAIDFATSIHCHNLVFGCPRNRNIPVGENSITGVNFFKNIADYAESRGTVIGLEANPVIYNTNFINDTDSAFRVIREVDSKAFRLNLDVGSMIYNKESPKILSGKVNLINHVHISEPMLKPIEEREFHKKLRDVLEKENYLGFVSIEMGKTDNLACLKTVMEYVKDIYGDEEKY